MNTTTLFRDLEPVASGKLRHMPRPAEPEPAKPPKPPGILDKVLSVFASEEEKLEMQRRELEAKKEQARQLALQYKELKTARDLAAENLQRADKRVEIVRRQRESNLSKIAEMFRSRVPGASDGDMAHGLADVGAKVAGADVALGQFAEARLPLVERLATAEKNLSDFCRKNGVPTVDAE